MNEQIGHISPVAVVAQADARKNEDVREKIDQPADLATLAPPAKIKSNQNRSFPWADLLLRSGFILMLVAIWGAAHYYLVDIQPSKWSGALFPSPLDVGHWIWAGFGLTYLTGHYQPPPGYAQPHSFLQALQQSDYPPAIWLSIVRLLEGYLIAVGIGFPLGLLVARFPVAEKTIGWLAVSLQGLPSICWIPLALLWFGRLSITAPILFVTIAGSLFATVVSVADGIGNVPPLMSRAGRTLGAKGLRLYFSVLLPAALPGIVSGLKIGWSFAWRSLMAAELIVNSGGLGFLLQRDRDNGDTEGVLASIIIIIVLGLAVQSAVFAPTENRLKRLWGLNKN